MTLQIRLFGAFSCHLTDRRDPLKLGSKQTALLALLATAVDGRRTRVWLQSLLWPLTGLEQQRGSLRQAISALKRQFGADFDAIFTVDHHAIALNLEQCEIQGKPQDGAFLEGFKIAGASGFHDWLSKRRRNLAVGLNEPHETATTLQTYDLVRIRPSVAVLPFASAPGSDIHPQFGDLIASDVSRYLCRASGIDVISHLSCRTEKFQNTGMLELRDSFRVNYLITGHVRKLSGARIRLDLEFLDVDSAKIVTAESFEAGEREFLEGDFGQIDRIARFIARVMFESALKKTQDVENKNIDAHAMLMSSIALMHRQDLASVSLSRQHLESVIQRHPGLAMPYAWLAKWYVLFISQGWSTDLSKDAARAREAVAKALAINPACSFSQVIAGLVQYQLFRKFDKADKQFSAVLNFDENNALAWIMSSTLHAFAGKGREAVKFADRARFLSPLEPGSYLFETLSAAAYLSDHQYDEALALCDQSLLKNPHHVSSLRAKTVALHGMGRMDEARQTVRALLKVEPGLTIQDYLSNHASTDFDIGHEWARALRDSGVPQK